MPAWKTHPLFDGTSKALELPFTASFKDFADQLWTNCHQYFFGYTSRITIVQDFPWSLRCRNIGPTNAKGGKTYGYSKNGSPQERSWAKKFTPEDPGEGDNVKCGRVLPKLSFIALELSAIRSQEWPFGPPNWRWTISHSAGHNWLSIEDNRWEGRSAGFTELGIWDICSDTFNADVVKNNLFMASLRDLLRPPWLFQEWITAWLSTLTSTQVFLRWFWKASSVLSTAIASFVEMDCSTNELTHLERWVRLRIFPNKYSMHQ